MTVIYYINYLVHTVYKEVFTVKSIRCRVIINYSSTAYV